MQDYVHYVIQFIADLQSQMPHLQFTAPFPQFPNFNPQPDLNAEKDDEDGDEELEDDQINFDYFEFII